MVLNDLVCSCNFKVVKIISFKDYCGLLDTCITLKGKVNTAYSLSRIEILDGFYCVPMKMDRSSVCPRQVSRFYASGKPMILQQVPLLPSKKLTNSPELFLSTVF